MLPSDGAPVTDADDIRTLIQSTPLRRLGAVIAEKNARYNIGNVRRTFNEPTFALLVVDPQVQRQGLGRTLLERCEQRAREAGCAQVRLEVREGNRQAIAFYRQCGYAQTHERPGYYGANESALCFSRALP